MNDILEEFANKLTAHLEGSRISARTSEKRREALADIAFQARRAVRKAQDKAVTRAELARLFRHLADRADRGISGQDD